MSAQSILDDSRPPASISALDGKAILLTGATGSFGRAFTRILLQHGNPASLRLYSRDELKQYELGQEFADPRLRFQIGDVRDLPRLSRAMRGVDVVIHAAAMKQVPICEYNPFEAVQTNVVGAENIVSAAIDNNVPRVIALSTDKAVNPVNLYGATKLCAERIITQGNAYAGDSAARFSSVRYGNVVGSRGSAIPLFLRQAGTELTITDTRMTRFWITLSQAVYFVIDSLTRMLGGEVFIPRIPSMRIVDLAEALAPGTPQRIVGIRPGEKIHEILITSDEAAHAAQYPDYFAIYPQFPFWDASYPAGEPLSGDFAYTSNNNESWLDPAAIRAMVSPMVEESR